MTSVLSQSMAQGGTGSASNEAAAAAAHAITAAAATAGLTQHMAFRGHPEGGHSEVGIDHQDQVHGKDTSKVSLVYRSIDLPWTNLSLENYVFLEAKNFNF